MTQQNARDFVQKLLIIMRCVKINNILNHLLKKKVVINIAIELAKILVIRFVMISAVECSTGIILKKKILN